MTSQRTVAVLYTGGTIGMKRGPRGYAPERGYLAERMASMGIFHDPSAERFTLPASEHGPPLRYEIFEYDRLVDSSNMRREDWVGIARDIERLHDGFDGFVVVHGTDTMAYTASALSFML